MRLFCGPLTLVHRFQSGSTARAPPLAATAPLLGRQQPHVYSITTHYSVRRHGPRTRRDGDKEGSDFTERKKKRPSFHFYENSSVLVFSGGNHWTAKA